MFNTKQEQDFVESIFGTDILEYAVEWVGDNLTPEEVFTDDQLEDWALENGFVEED